MSSLHIKLRVFPRASLASRSSGKVSLPWALRSASLSTSSDSTQWTRGSPETASSAPERTSRRPPGGFYRAVHLTGLDHSVTLTTLFRSIAETAPVGSILSARLHPADTTPHAAPTGEGDEPGPQSQSTSALREGRRQTPQQQRADILFGNEDAPYNLVRAARAKTFLVQGRTPYVTINRQLLFRGTQIELRRSRVLHIIGAPDEEGFDEETIRAVLQSSPTAMEAVGALGVSSEPVETRDEVVGAGEDGGAAPRTIRTMEWRFFDTAQGKVFKRVLREHFGMRLVVRSAPDPCWDYRAMEQYLQRLSGVRSGGGRGGGGGGQLLRQHRGPAAPPAGVEVEPSTPVWPAYFMETAIRTREDKPTKDKLAEESEAAPEQPTETAIETREDKPAEATEVNETVPEQPTSTDKQ